MVKQIKKNQSRNRQKTLAVVMALVNGLNSAAPLVLPLAAIDATAPVARRGESGRELATSFNRGGQLLERLFFSTAYAGEVIGDGVIKDVEPGNSPADGDTINNGGIQNVNADGSATNTTINNSGTQNVNAGGSATNTIINDGGQQRVYAGGSATGTQINDGGSQTVHGSESNTTIYGMQHVYGTASGSLIAEGGEQTVHAGGTTTNLNIKSGGTQTVNSGGTVNGIIFISGGQSLLGTVSGTSIESGVTIANGGKQFVNVGGSATNTTIENGGEQNVYDGGTATNTIISAGGQQSVYDGGAAINLNIYGSQTVYGTTSGSMIMDGGQQTVENGGIATNLSIESGGTQNVRNGGTVNGNITISGTQNLAGTASGAFIENGGEQSVNAGGIATSTTIKNSGTQNVNLNGIATSTTINSGGTQNVYTGGIANGTTINGFIGAGETPSIHGTQELSGIASGTIISSGGQQNVNAGGSDISATIHDGGKQYVNSNGSATSATINGGGWQSVSTGGIANGSTINGVIKHDGSPNIYGTQELEGTASNTIINNGGQQVVDNGGTANSTTINSEGQQVVFIGTATGTTVNTGGKQIVYTGSTVSDTIINGGEQEVNATVNGTIVNAGFQIVKGGGTASGTTVHRYANQTVSGGGTAISTNVYGEQIVYPSASVNGTTIHNGGWQVVWSGANVTDNVISGGTVSLANNGAALSGSTILHQGSIQAGLYNGVSYTIEDLTVTGGKIILNNIIPETTNKTADRKLTIEKLTGAANFVIATDLANSKADHITIDSGGPAQHTLQVAYDPLYETGGTIEGASASFAAVPGGGTSFTAVTTDYGAYRYTPSLAASPDGTVWSVTGLGLSDPDSPEPSETVYTASDTATGSLMIWRQENNSIMRRMGELRDNPGQSGDWVRVYKGEQEIANNGNRNTTQRYTAIQGGHDSKVDFGGRTWRAGYTVGYLDSDINLARGSGDASSLSVGAYAAWLGDKGHFLDLIIKQGRLKTSYDSHLNDPGNTKVSGSYHNWGTSLSAEYGWRKQLTGKWYLEPQAELTMGRLGSASYKASDGTTVDHNSLNSVIGRLGLAAGRAIGSGTFYAKASLVREFNANARVTMASGGHAPVTLEQNLKENWLEMAVGVTGALSNKTDGYLEVSRTTGDKVKTPWQVNLGARWNL